MSKARIRFDGKEIEPGDRMITCGRAADNAVSFPGDANVSRYHAEIEKRPDGYWIIDLNSSNGTTVNGVRIYGEAALNFGDEVVLGGTSRFDFIDAESEAETPATAAPVEAGVERPIEAEPAPPAEAGETADVAATAMPPAAAANPKNLLLIAGIICCVAVLCVAGGAAAIYFKGGSACAAKAVITKPEPGDTIANPTEIEVEADETGCVARAVFTLDGVEIASADSEPYSATLDPDRFPDLADGLNHSLQIVLLDENGAQIGQPTPVMLAFESRAVEPEATPEVTKGPEGQQNTPAAKNSAVSLLDTQQMALALVKQFRGGFNYNISNKQFLEEIKKRTADYAVEGYFARASAYRDVINVAYVREQNLDAPLGFILAMSRSKFVPGKQGDNEGLWQMSGAFVTANAYNGPCGTESLSDASQNCAAKASALYMKAIVYGVFDGDPVYGAAAFGKSPQDAATWKATLPANKADVWNVIKTPQEREQLIRFFAAGIVAENPQRFGLKNDRPLDELYRVTM